MLCDSTEDCIQELTKRARNNLQILPQEKVSKVILAQCVTCDCCHGVQGRISKISPATRPQARAAEPVAERL